MLTMYLTNWPVSRVHPQSLAGSKFEGFKDAVVSYFSLDPKEVRIFIDISTVLAEVEDGGSLNYHSAGVRVKIKCTFSLLAVDKDNLTERIRNRLSQWGITLGEVEFEDIGRSFIRNPGERLG